MTIVNLGTSDLEVGLPEAVYGAVDYRTNRAYAIYLSFTSDNFPNLFSFVRIYTLIRPLNLPPRLLSNYADINPTTVSQLLLFPCSNLFDSNGEADFLVQRRPFYRGGGDRPDLNLTMTYDDQLFANTWL